MGALHSKFYLPLIDNSLKLPQTRHWTNLLEVAMAQLPTDKPYAVRERHTPVIVSNGLFLWSRASASGLADITLQLGPPWGQARLSEPSEQIATRAAYVHKDDSLLQPSTLKWPICLQVRRCFDAGNAGHRPQIVDTNRYTQ